MLWDTHMHTHFSGDSEADPKDMIRAAKALGLSGICFTDHLDLDFPDEPELFLMDVDQYIEEMNTFVSHAQGSQRSVGVSGCAQGDTTRSLEVCIGIELGLQPHLAEKHRELTASHPFDFIIGSSHVVHGKDPYYPAFYQNKVEDEAYAEYFSSILENIAVFDDFDVYGHLDYVVRYGPNKNKFYSYEKFADIIDEILRALIAKGKGIELNTAGFKYGLGHPNPTEAVIKRYRELGGEIITIGSDAHAPEHVGYDFAKVPGILTDAGFRYFTVYKNRKPQFLRLP